MSKMKYWVVFVVAISVITLGVMVVSCGTVGLDSHMTNLNLGKITENVATTRDNSGIIFELAWIRKDGASVSMKTNINTNANVPFVLKFNNGVISDYDIVIYHIIDINSTRGSAITINSNKIFDAGDSSELWLYTETLVPSGGTATFEMVIIASATKNTLGQCMDNDGDTIAGETEDNLNIWFSITNSVLATNKMTASFLIVSYPPANDLVPANTFYGSNHIMTNFNALRNCTNAVGNFGMDTASFGNAVTVLNKTDDKTYPMTIAVLDGTNLTSTMASSLPPGFYTITVQENLIKESVAVNGYIHRASSYDKTNTFDIDNFVIITTNALPTRGGPVLITSSSKILELSFSVDMDWSTFTSATVFITNNVGETLNTTLTPVSSDTIRISSPSSGSFGGDGSVTNRTWSIVLFNYKLKSVNGDIISSQGETWTWTD